MRGLIISAPASGSGKTLVTLGLLRHLINTGEKVVSVKAGPDYIDPAFHRASSGKPCWNVDVWAMREEMQAAILKKLSNTGDIAVCEGVMGLFDGARVAPGQIRGSTADVARLTNWPVVLVVDASAQSESAAAVVRGFATHEPNTDIAGVIFNRIGGPVHADILVDAMARALPLTPVIGCLPRVDGLELPSRYLGLVQALEHPDLESFINHAARLIAQNLDIEVLKSLARPLTALGVKSAKAIPIGRRISVAWDAAFTFAYEHLLDDWRQAGAEIKLFSPLGDEPPWADSDAIYLPGGYPELYAGKLASNNLFLSGLREAADRGVCIFGECGGYMVLGNGLTDSNGQYHRMAGLLGLETSFADPHLHLGYRSASLETESFLGAAGTVFRAHEFHYATVLEEQGGEPLFRVSDAAGCFRGFAGQRCGKVAGSFLHLIDQYSLPAVD